jgi:hypothetical protein
MCIISLWSVCDIPGYLPLGCLAGLEMYVYYLPLVCMWYPWLSPFRLPGRSRDVYVLSPFGLCFYIPGYLPFRLPGRSRDVCVLSPFKLYVISQVISSLGCLAGLETECGDGRCIRNSWVCDGYHDCSTDEAGCGRSLFYCYVRRIHQTGCGRILSCYYITGITRACAESKTKQYTPGDSHDAIGSKWCLNNYWNHEIWLCLAERHVSWCLPWNVCVMYYHAFCRLCCIYSMFSGVFHKWSVISVLFFCR